MKAEKYKLVLQTRSVSGRKVKKLRSSGIVPASIFGNKIKSVSVQLDTKQFLQVFSAAGESSLIYLHLDKESDPRPSFVSQISLHPTTGSVLHVAFHQVDLKEKVTAQVPVILVGESMAEKEKTGIQVQQADEIEIESLPADMPENIQVDVSSLTQPGDHISIKDLKLDLSKLNIKTDPDQILVQIEGLAKEEVAPVVEVPVEPGAEPAAESATPAAAEDKAVAEKE